MVGKFFKTVHIATDVASKYSSVSSWSNVISLVPAPTNSIVESFIIATNWLELVKVTDPVLFES